MLDQVRLHYTPPQDGFVIPNTRTGDFAPRGKRDVVFACGRVWDEGKNIASLCRVAPMLQWPVIIAGDTRHPSGRSVALSCVRLLGNVDRGAIAEQLAHAAIYALPAYYEPFGLSALEAALSGCALVLGRIGSLQEIWEDDALYVTPADERELIEAINGLIANPELRMDLGGRARRRALDLTPARMTEGYLNLYEEAGRRFGEKSHHTAAVENICA
jgi:glycosyltransferase involved in cell wall biosynthesis